jgi:ABC-type Fe3+/spermidine/putrescine transport system ATPase subunit
MELADRIVVMNAGHIEQIGRPGDLYLEPDTLTVARFIGQMNKATVTLRGGRADWLGQPVALSAPDGPVTLLCRPEDLQRDRAGITGRVTRVVDLGPMIRVTIATDDGATLTWLCGRDDQPQPGAPLTLRPSRLLAYRDGQRLGTAAPVADRSRTERA